MDIKQVIVELSMQTHYKPLQNHFECEIFKNTLRNDIKKNLESKAILYIHDQSLVVCAKNNACLQDLILESNKKVLLNSLRLYQKLKPTSSLSHIKDIKYKVAKYNTYKTLHKSTTKDYHIEHSDGKFDNILSLPQARQTLEQIKLQIQKNNKKI